MQKAWKPRIITGSGQGSELTLGQDTHNNDGWMFRTPWNRVLLDKLTVPRIGKKFPAFSGNRRVHYSIYNWPSIIPIMSEIKPVRAPIPLNKHFNIIFPATNRFYKGSLFRFHDRNPICINLHHMGHMPPPICPHVFDSLITLTEKYTSWNCSFCKISFLQPPAVFPSYVKLSPLTCCMGPVAQSV